MEISVYFCIDCVQTGCYIARKKAWGWWQSSLQIAHMWMCYVPCLFQLAHTVLGSSRANDISQSADLHFLGGPWDEDGSGSEVVSPTLDTTSWERDKMDKSPSGKNQRSSQCFTSGRIMVSFSRMQCLMWKLDVLGSPSQTNILIGK